ncbi:MAG: DNA-protecting protein DprA, partial [Betaproteobacteria bacterium]|nr:DNA-protecting protein DprA [Betaproteobacteria bacterium]
MGPATIAALVEALGSPEAVLAATRTQLAGVVGDSKARLIQEGCKPTLLERSLTWLAQPNHFLVGLDAPDYPESLLQIGQAPPVLYGMGRRELLRAPMIAVVGSRNPTAQGERDAFAFSQALSQAGLTVVSGLALGIGTHAHRGGLSAAGASVAVVGTGLDRVYPARNHALAQELAHDGLLLSEFALGTAPLPGNFPRRNRIISGLSKGCLVVEAAMNSGSLVTARLAVAQGRDVFAIPGSIHSALSKGCHALIKEGAKL